MPARIIRKVFVAYTTMPLPAVSVVLDLLDALDDDLKDIGFEPGEATEKAMDEIKKYLTRTNFVVDENLVMPPMVSAAQMEKDVIAAKLLPPVENIMTNPELRPPIEEAILEDAVGEPSEAELDAMEDEEDETEVD